MGSATGIPEGTNQIAIESLLLVGVAHYVSYVDGPGIGANLGTDVAQG